ncbi:NADH:ubiquinone oxidoreductase [Gordonibacter sp. An230]|uniref:NADH-quinone oxidoreductase subunit C n=1 Tax=Gordonibacter sp. An230 TaxID=1965592 RepID=UPI000B37554A|nr:NADH-quinone oxidoreductase subunit C [Gordonibacter sp. An230]OUO91461.1 NADH:ubiquinone oxidoreductase [Gordonibacter sp. An230]
MTLETEFVPLCIEELPALAAEKKAEGARFVQLLAVNAEEGVDLIYTFMRDGVLTNHEIKGVGPSTVVPSITDQFLAAFVFENEVHDLFGVSISDIAIDFGGNFYALAQKEPMTIISPEQKAAREKARKLAAAKAAKERQPAARAAQAEYLAGHPDAHPGKPRGPIEPSGSDDLDARLAGVDPEKVARVKAALAAKAKKASETAAGNAELEKKLAGMDPEKAAKVRAAMEAKARREPSATEKEGE